MGGPKTDSDNATFNITATNNPPQATITPPSYAVVEDIPFDLHGTGLTVSDPDASSNMVRAMLSVGEGTLDVAAGTTGVTVTNSGTTMVTLDGTLIQLNDLLAGNFGATIRYQALEAPSAATLFTLAINDQGHSGVGGALNDSDNATLNITAVNDAPILDNTGTMTLTYVLQDEADPPGESVAAMIASAGGDRVTDPDSGAVEGIGGDWG